MAEGAANWDENQGGDPLSGGDEYGTSFYDDGTGFYGGGGDGSGSTDALPGDGGGITDSLDTSGDNPTGDPFATDPATETAWDGALYGSDNTDNSASVDAGGGDNASWTSNPSTSDNAPSGDSSAYDLSDGSAEIPLTGQTIDDLRNAGWSDDDINKLLDEPVNDGTGLTLGQAMAQGYTTAELLDLQESQDFAAQNQAQVGTNNGAGTADDAFLGGDNPKKSGGGSSGGGGGSMGSFGGGGGGSSAKKPAAGAASPSATANSATASLNNTLQNLIKSLTNSGKATGKIPASSLKTLITPNASGSVGSGLSSTTVIEIVGLVAVALVVAFAMMQSGKE